MLSGVTSLVSPPSTSLGFPLLQTPPPWSDDRDRPRPVLLPRAPCLMASEPLIPLPLFHPVSRLLSTLSDDLREPPQSLRPLTRRKPGMLPVLLSFSRVPETRAGTCLYSP